MPSDSLRRFSTADIPDLAGKVVIVTGGSSGLGFESAVALAAKGAHVIVSCRNEDKGNAAVADIKAKAGVPAATVEFGVMEQSDLASVRRFADWFLAKGLRLDVLMLNAGVFGTKFELVDGVETHMLVNHLSHMLLAQLLLPKLKQSAPSRIVFVGSETYKDFVHDEESSWAADFERGFSSKSGPADVQHALSKLAVVTTSNRIARVLGHHAGVLVNTVDPRLSMTKLWAGSKDPLTNGWLRSLLRRRGRIDLVDPKEGALALLFAATSPSIEQLHMSGMLFVGAGVIEKALLHTLDPAVQDELWAVSEAHILRILAGREVAERVAREGRLRHFDVRVSAMDEYDKAELPNEPLVLFVCSVTGQGEEPDNMKRFWKFLLRKNLPSDSLEGMRFGVFGLGDSSYPKFNFPAKKLHKRLMQLGAQPLVARGDGDDQHDYGYDGALDPWLEQAWQAILALYPLPRGLEIVPADTLVPPPLEAVFVDDLARRNQLEAQPQNAAQDAAPANQRAGLPVTAHLATVKVNRRVTSADHFQDVRHFEFDIAASHVEYNTGDIMTIQPQNLPSDVAGAIESLGWTDIADRPLVILATRADVRVPEHLRGEMTIRRLFEHHLDLFGRPHRYFFELLAFFATDEMHAEKLREFASAAGQSELYAYCHRMRRTRMEVISDFASLKVPVKYIVDIFPPMRPRSFSIASSPLVRPHAIELAVGIVTYRTRMREPRHGVCTKWMAQLQAGDVVRFGVQAGTFRLPLSINTPIVCIGPGTGVAPMRSLLQTRHELGASENTLFVGTRSRTSDFLYGEEWTAWAAQGSLQLFTAFSRDQNHKIYVQHRIVEHGVHVWDIVGERGGTVYLSGNSKQMPADVADALKQVFVQHGRMSHEDAERMLSDLERARRFQQECWA
ncbi:NAPDH-dependent diflavin reductase [Polyrhizophydium stewartii]|uniref:NADPH-dependent diflavin oxidoreductase 1 n=1 Tax=Polyrhizophydium stewartii TaxID=2732419 RepID=A0ABR4MWW2_9FUNG